MNAPRSAAAVSAWHSAAESLVHVTVPVESERIRFERVVHEGLSRTPKALSSMYFYDERGSELFRRIMELPEYYLTRVEREILALHGSRIVAPFAESACDVVDLGAGDGVKTRILIERLRQANADVRYVPIDVSKGALESALEACSREMPWLAVEGVIAEYAEGLRWLAARARSRPRLVLLLGSNVGNLDDQAARGFFRMLRGVLQPGDHVLVGFDLVKDVDRLQRAYDDSAGVTAQFNLNLLLRINRELGGEFDPAKFRHFAVFSPHTRAMESFLLSKRRQSVRVGAVRYEFDAWEPIHTEISRKYRQLEIGAFAAAAGFLEVGHFVDEQRSFVDALWRVPDDDAGADA
jgi:dimethylhistidine N-methyltransferase